MYIPLSSLSDAPNNPVPALFHRNQDLRAQHGFPGGVEGKESACNAGDTGSVPGSGRFPGEGNGNLLQYSCLGESHGQRSLVAYSPWGHKESDITERVALAQPPFQGLTESRFRHRYPDYKYSF